MAILAVLVGIVIASALSWLKPSRSPEHEDSMDSPLKRESKEVNHAFDYSLCDNHRSIPKEGRCVLPLNKL
jgi:hypothetical protein